jgi:hypothetical protein
MAQFKIILTNAGASALTVGMYTGKKVVPDFALVGSGIFDSNPAIITELVNPANAGIKIIDREFIEAEGKSPSLLKITTQVSNAGITKITPIREIMLYANSNGGADMENAVPFAYAWLDGDDTDNILAPPINPDQQDTQHTYELVLFVTNQQLANIEVNFSLCGFVTHRYLQEVISKATVEVMPRFEGDALVFD